MQTVNFGSIQHVVYKYCAKEQLDERLLRIQVEMREREKVVCVYHKLLPFLIDCEKAKEKTFEGVLHVSVSK